MDRVATSKFLSYVLRHHPEAIGVELDENGWVPIETLLAKLAEHGRNVSRAELEEIVRTSDKQRFAIEGERIRANQGHSIAVDLALSPREPPAVLHHGTVERFLGAIRREGLIKGERTHVHLSAEIETARIVAARRGKPVILTIDARAMHAEGHTFFLSDNGVWLTEHVPPRFIA
ncbi:MAG: RNA 2'-phosphotransferase [Polyangiales bacterium]